VTFGSLGLDLSLFATCEKSADANAFEATLESKDVSGTGKIGIAKDVRCGKGPGK
jgi:hypothetical protein